MTDDDAPDFDRVIVATTTTVDADPDVVDEEWLAERYPDTDYATAHNRHGGWLALVGDEPDWMLCPDCGGACRSSRVVDGAVYFVHKADGDVDCDSDVSAIPESGSTAQKRDGSGLGFNPRAVAVAAVAFTASAWVLNVAIQGQLASAETPTIDKLWGLLGLVFLVLIVAAIILGMTVMPRTARGRGR